MTAHLPSTHAEALPTPTAPCCCTSSQWRVSTSPGMTCLRKRALLMPPNSASLPLFSGRLSAAWIWQATLGVASGAERVAQMQQQLLYDYEEDITKYAQGLDKGKIKNIYNHIPVFLGRDNKKFQITKVAHGARSRDYVGTVEWLKDAGIVNVCYCLDQVSLPLKGNYNPRLFKLYYHDTGMLVASLDAESQDDLRQNRNYGTYKGGLFENIVSEMLVKQGYQLYFYRNDKSTVEMGFFVRTASSLVPVEVKASDNSTPSLNNLTGKPDKYPDIKFGIKLCDKNIGFNGKFYTFPYFLTFMLRRFLKERK